MLRCQEKPKAIGSLSKEITMTMEDRKKDKEKTNDDYLLYKREINGEEDIENFIGHIKWWQQIARDNKRKLVLVLQARLNS